MQEPEPLQQVDRTYVRLGGRKLSYFSGCDYFRMASHPLVLRAVRDGLECFGLSASASRLTTGNHALYGELERALADFFAAENATLIPTGYLAGLAVAQTLAGTFSHALIDERAHPALRDTASALDCPVLTFKHRDPLDFGRAVNRCGREARLAVLTDGMFAFDGSVAPLKEYLGVMPPDALVVVDDAHGAGVLGQNGRGTVEHCGVSRDQVVQFITLSKAFGGFGGVILGDEELRRKIVERSRVFIGSTPLPLPLANAALRAVSILKRQGMSYRKRLARNVKVVRSELRKASVPVPDCPGPVISVVPGSARAVSDLKALLLRAGIYPPFITYPGGPENGFFRFVISSEHTPGQLANVAESLKAAGLGAG